MGVFIIPNITNKKLLLTIHYQFKIIDEESNDIIRIFYIKYNVNESCLLNNSISKNFFARKYMRLVKKKNLY